MNNARNFGLSRSARHFATDFVNTGPYCHEACAPGCNECERARSETEETDMQSTRSIWREMHYSRRVGEQVPDATYSCSVERPRPGRIRDWLYWTVAIGLILAALLAPSWWMS